MPKFTYKAKEGPAKIIDGVIEAPDINNALNKIIRLGLTPIDVLPEGQLTEKKDAPRLRPLQINFFNRVRLADVVLFTRQMSDLVEAAVPMLKSLQIVSNQTANPTFKAVVDNMYLTVKDGGALSDALAQHSRIFSPLYINMVKSGELSGQLETVLSRLANYLEHDQDTQSKVRSSLAYPILIMAVGILTVFVLLTFVIPRLSVMFEDLNQELPTPTLILLNVSDFMTKFWLIIVGGFIFLIIVFQRWAQTPEGREQFDRFKLRIPRFGYFIKVVEIGRFARTLGTLVESGVVITKALNAVWATIDNVVLRNEIKKVSEAVTNGSSLKMALRQCSFFPEMAINMIAVGEETGFLERSLYKIADTYERQSDQTVKTVLSLLGPLVLIVIVAIVGFVVMAMLLPIFKMNMIVQ